MKEDIQNYSPTVMFPGTPYSFGGYNLELFVFFLKLRNVSIQFKSKHINNSRNMYLQL